MVTVKTINKMAPNTNVATLIVTKIKSWYSKHFVIIIAVIRYAKGLSLNTSFSFVSLFEIPKYAKKLSSHVIVILCSSELTTLLSNSHKELAEPQKIKSMRQNCNNNFVIPTKCKNCEMYCTENGQLSQIGKIILVTQVKRKNVLEKLSAPTAACVECSW